MNGKKCLIAIIISLLFLSGIPIGIPQPTPVTVYGFVKDSDGASLPNGVTIVVKNVDTGDYSNVTTSSGTYLSYISASIGDTIRSSCSYGDDSGSNTTTVQDRLVQYCNLTLELAVAPPKQSPIADFSWSPYNPVEGETVQFDDQSRDPDGEVVAWSWGLGDGTTSTSRYPSNSYMAGTYIVTLVVTDNDGLTGDRKDWVVVREREDGEDDRDWIPPPPPTPEPYYTVPQMYRLLNVDELHSSNKIKIAIIDTGVTLRTYNNTDMSNIRVYKHPSYASGIDEYGHGTFVAHEISYAIQNYCPNSILYSIRALDESGRASILTVLECFNIAKELDVDIISVSLGARGEIGDALDRKMKQMRRDGIVVVCAAGNYGPIPSSVISPALSPHALAIGATDPKGTIEHLQDDLVTDWSSRGPILEAGETKPDMVAPGLSVIGPYLDEETIMSGTSVSAPFVSGGALVAMAKNKFLLDILSIEYFFWPGLRPKLVEESIESTCFEKGDEFSYGAGIPDFERGSSKLRSLCIFYIMIPIIIILLIIAVVIVAYHYYKKKK